MTLRPYVEAAAAAAGVSCAFICGRARPQPVAAARQAAMALAYIDGAGSSPQIGHAFGYRDHTTVLHAVKAWREGRLAGPAAKVREALTGQGALL
jgi:chromosomal replication initiation ATPase DnaA